MRQTKYFGSIMMILFSSILFAGSPILKISDIKGDAASSIGSEFVDLDLISLSAESHGKTTVFKATFNSRIETPDSRVISQSGATLQSFAPNGFYTFNLDVYINPNSSGNVNDLNGGSPFAWEKVVCLNPRPHAAKMMLREEMKRRALKEVIAKKGSYTSADEKEVAQRINAQIDEHIYFPTLIRVHGSTIEFTVPDSFLGQKANSNWDYAAGVTRSSVLDYINQTTGRSQASLQAEYNDVVKLPSLLVQENLLMQRRESYVDLIVASDLQKQNK